MARVAATIVGAGAAAGGAVWTILTALTDPMFLFAHTGLTIGAVRFGTELGRNLGPSWVPWGGITLGVTTVLLVVTLAKIYQKRKESRT